MRRSARRPAATSHETARWRASPRCPGAFPGPRRRPFVQTTAAGTGRAAAGAGARTGPRPGGAGSGRRSRRNAGSTGFGSGSRGCRSCRGENSRRNRAGPTGRPEPSTLPPAAATRRAAAATCSHSARASPAAPLRRVPPERATVPSNLLAYDGGEAFSDDFVAAAMIDRLANHAEAAAGTRIASEYGEGLDHRHVGNRQVDGTGALALTWAQYGRHRHGCLEPVGDADRRVHRLGLA
ncbi:hypothetical protein SBRY_40706 [Actinacidiphila bryophytorum]|uniref:Uncharacterized protein n=1 Tax=Actinacidiphila bryophytorum TaxID=1436133 RepID=A0A9W4H3H4_9ACTN|nr:hypothetical protein SBRY_40706 [Actinacidiphila bryophytorum]